MDSHHDPHLKGNRREHFRVSYRTTVEVFPEWPRGTVELRSRNLSGGGLGALSRRELRPGARLRMVLPMADSELETEGIVVRCVRLRRRVEGCHYSIGVRFRHPHRSVEETIVRFVLDLQRVQLRRR